MTRVPVSMIFNENSTPGSILKDNTITSEKLSLRSEPLDPIALTSLRKESALNTLLGSPSGSDLGLVTSGNAHYISAGDVMGVTVSRKATFELLLPHDYVAGETVKLRFMAGMLTNTASVSAQLDVSAYVSAQDGTVGSDICDTAIQSINSTTIAAKDFELQSSGLVPGDRIFVEITIAAQDGSGSDARTPIICDIWRLIDRR